VALGGEVVDLVGLGFLHDADKVGGVGHVPVVQVKPGARLVRILVEVIDPRGVEGRRPALHAMHLVALLQKQLDQIGAVLSGGPRYQSAFRHWATPSLVCRKNGAVS
jgi:hypothetical protein